MSGGDPSGYYQILGVASDASADSIKSAYRRLAKDLHPDRNQGDDATAAFQAIQEAYSVLGDDDRRAQYDAFGAIPPSQSDGDETTSRHIDPIRCSQCESVTAQPRFKVFYFIVGYFVGAYKKPLQGVFCLSCEWKVALKATIGTIFLGWWNVNGFLWTIHALFSNLIGGRFPVQDAFLQGQQAFYFAQQGNFDLSGATARGALGLIEKAKTSSENSANYNNLESLRNSLLKLLNSIPKQSSNKSIKERNAFYSKTFLFQSIVITLFIFAISASILINQRAQQVKEAERLKQEGISQARAYAIAEEQASALRAMEKPLPPSGVYHSKFRGPKTDWPPFKINNAPGANALIKLVRASDGVAIISIFVRAGETVEVDVPIGSYKAKIASGQTWYGDEIRFGPNTNYGEFGGIFDFRIEGDQLAGKEITLTRVANGNLERSEIDASQF